MRVFAAIEVLALLLAGALHASGDWSCFRGDARLTGQCDVIPKPPYRLAWSFRTGGLIKSSPVVAGNRVFFGSRDGNVYAVNLKNGEKIWSHETGDDVDASPLVVDGTVFIGSASGQFHALRAADGKILWTHTCEDRILGSANVLTTPDKAQAIVFGSYDMHLYCLAVDTGKILWKRETDNYVNGAPAVDQKRVVFGGCDGMLRVLSSMGKETLRVNVDSHIAASPAVSDGIAYLGQYQGVAMAVDLATGKILWKHGGGQESEPFLAPPALDDKRMYIGSRDKSMHCLDRKTGERIWTFRTRGQIEGAAVVGSGRLIFGSADGMLYVLDAKTGGKMFAFEIGAGISSSPAIANGCVLVTAEDGTLYAFTAVANDN